MTTVRVTSEQVRAARIEVKAFEAAGLTPDPLVVELAATPLPSEAPHGVPTS